MRLISGLLILSFGIFSCGHSKEKKSVPAAKNTAMQAKSILRTEDSLFLEKSLADALTLAGHHKNEHRFADSASSMTPDSIYTVDVAINQDYYFSKEMPHLIIRRKAPDVIYIDIFANTKGGFEKVLRYKQDQVCYINDTIYDINGDGLNDFVINWYGSSGCCLKAFSDVFLLRANKRSFSGGFDFINPTFSPKEGVIRGLCYGQPGETEMYKYKWHGECVDTLEYISYERNSKGKKTGRFVISNAGPWDNYKILKIVKRIPAEYKKIDGYDWFRGIY